MNQLAIVQTIYNQGPLHKLQIIFTILALLSFALGSALLSLMWFGTAIEGRAFVLILLWPATMLATWIFSMLALLMVKRWLLAALSLPVAIAIFYGIWIATSLYFNDSTIMFTTLLILLNIGTMQLARWFLKSTSRGTISNRYQS